MEVKRVSNLLNNINNIFRKLPKSYHNISYWWRTRKFIY